MFPSFFFHSCSIWWFEWISICDAAAVFAVIVVAFVCLSLCRISFKLHLHLGDNDPLFCIWTCFKCQCFNHFWLCRRWVIHWLVKNKKKMPMRFLCCCLVHNKMYNNQNLCIAKKPHKNVLFLVCLFIFYWNLFGLKEFNNPNYCWLPSPNIMWYCWGMLFQ